MDLLTQGLGRLFLVPTPLGEEGPVGCLTERGLQTVRGLRHFAVENARTARRFLSALGMPVPIESLGIEVLDKRVDRESAIPLLAPLLSGYDLGILSEAGAPGVADPGAVLVALAQERGIEVCPLVGPSSILLTLMASGLNGQNFAFVGYLPVQSGARRARLRELETYSRRERQAQAFIETPYRNEQLLKDVLQTLGTNTHLCLGRGIHTTGGWIRTQRIFEWRECPPTLGKVPTFFILEAE